MADALSRKSGSSLAQLQVGPIRDLIALRGLNVGLQLNKEGAFIAILHV